ncbi:hypothetical protein BGZ60DRAFT_402830 [Tricladium varicosporioides]|nr:hypothetical protein BGZ60DRAFT_402830 [Hymenoscyphus varicosporioides]
MLHTKDSYEDDRDVEEPFLSDQSEKLTSKSSQKKFWREKYFFFGAVQILLVIIYTTTSILYIRSHRSQCVNSPNELSNLNVIYEPKTMVAFQDSPYIGSPSASTDRAWHDLMSKMTIRVTSRELERGNQSSVELPNGGHMAWLGVFHEMHCVKMLRQWKYRDHYYPNITSQEESHKSLHADHCLEMLRASAMCHADRSLTTFKWTKHQKPMLDTKRPPHICVNWDSLISSINDRLVSDDELARIRNPILP